MTVKELQERKKELGFTYVQIAEMSGVPLGTVQKVLGGVTLTPRYETIMALEQVLGESGGDGRVLREPLKNYLKKPQGEYTREDYELLPDDIRVELIDGVIYTMAAPTSAHQLIAGFIYGKLLSHMLEKKGNCMPMISPLDVQIDCDDKTMVQPDVIIVCDRDKIINRCVYGAPDFVMEVLSKSSKRRDSVIKLHKYMSAGVREYWMIDPEQKKVIVYDFEAEDYPTVHGFDTVLPVRIWNGECRIDFNEVYEHIRFLYEREK